MVTIDDLGEGLPALPVRLAPLGNRKYYGTVVVDADGQEILKVWIGQPTRVWGDLSPREKAEGTDPEDLCDSHWEDSVSWRCACLFVMAVNRAGGAVTTPDMLGL